MTIAELFSEQLDREAAISRRVLAHAPEGRGEWKPHEKSMALGYLSYLVAVMPSWIEMAITKDELDLNPPAGKSGFKPRSDMSRKELRELNDESAQKALAALRGTSDAHLATPWRLLVGGKVVSQSPRRVVIADTFTHLAHHRGQLTVYMRLNGETVPSVYGPSADDKSFG